MNLIFCSTLPRVEEKAPRVEEPKFGGWSTRFGESRHRHYSEYEETIFKLIGGAPATPEFLEEPPQLSATEVTQLTNFRKSLTMNELKAKQSIKETL